MPGPGHFWTRLLLATMTLAAVLNLACFALRIQAALAHGDLAMTTGDEGFSVGAGRNWSVRKQPG